MFSFNATPIKKPYSMDNNLRKYIQDSGDKYNKLLIKINDDIKRKQDIQNILYGKALIKTTNHSVNDLINNCKRRGFFLFHLYH